MRYVIIPIAIILFIYWSYKSIKDMVKKKSVDPLEVDKPYTSLWLTCMYVFAIPIVMILAIIYW